MPTLSRRSAARALAITVGLFVLATAITATGALDRLDHGVASAVHRTTRHATDVALSLVAVTASVPVSLAWLGLLVVATQLAGRRRRRALVLTAGFAVASFVELVLKAALDHPGPSGSSRSVIAFGIEEVGRGSFPSGHMLRGTALALGTVYVVTGDRSRHAAALVAGVAVYVALLGWSRVYLNEHWTSDVIGGLLLGVAAALAVLAVPPLGRRTP